MTVTEALKAAQDAERTKAAQDTRDRLEALALFRADMSTFLRACSFLSQIFDYGNTAIEAWAIFYRRLLPLLEFGREHAEVDTSKIVLTHHRLTSMGARTLGLAGGAVPLKPMTEAGSGGVQDKEKALLAEILSRVNDLFQGDLTDDDQLIYVNGVIRGKLLENETLVQQSGHNSKQQFESSPSLEKALEDAIIDAFDAHTAMSKQALESRQIREGLIRILLGPGQLNEALRQKGGFETRGAVVGIARTAIRSNLLHPSAC